MGCNDLWDGEQEKGIKYNTPQLLDQNPSGTRLISYA